MVQKVITFSCTAATSLEVRYMFEVNANEYCATIFYLYAEDFSLDEKLY